MPQVSVDRQAVTQGMSMASIRADEIEAVIADIETHYDLNTILYPELTRLRGLAVDLRADLKKLGECID